MAAYLIPFLHHLFHRPAPRAIQRMAGGRVRWACSCGATWDE